MNALKQSKIVSVPLFIALLVIASLAHITADMYVPSMPAIVTALKSNPSMIQLTLSVYLFGFGASHLFYGPISDRIGRRKPILFGMGLTLIGGMICFIAPSIEILIIGRFLQGCGVGACTSVGRSLTRDLLSGPHLARLGSLMGMVMVFVTASAPTLGGYIQNYFSWRINFLVLFVFTSFAWFYIWKILPETHQYFDPTATKLKNVIKNYIFLLTNKSFMGYTLCMSFAYSGILAYLTAGPFLLQTVVGLSPIEFGWLAFVVGLSIFVSAVINSRLIFNKGIPFMMFAGIVLMLLGGLLMLIFAFMQWINVFSIMVPVALFCMGAGFTFSNAFAGAFHSLPKIAGTAGALFGCLQIVIASLVSAIMATSHELSQMPLACMLFTLALLSSFSMKYLASKELN